MNDDDIKKCSLYLYIQRILNKGYIITDTQIQICFKCNYYSKCKSNLQVKNTVNQNTTSQE